MAGRLLATDLDRTLLPNGAAEEDPAARPLLAALVAELGLTLAYVSGRRLELVQEALEEYSLPRPDYVVADVGSSLYEARGEGWTALPAWGQRLAEDWSGRKAAELAPLFASFPELALQEAQAQRAHKLSFTTPHPGDSAGLLERMRAVLAAEGLRAAVVHSVDEARGVGLVDVLPAGGTKQRALEFLLQRLGLSLDQVVFCGDSGNDLELLTGPLPAVLVANAQDELRARALGEAAAAGLGHRLHAARGGWLGLNGNYAAGILEGWAHFHPEDEQRLARLLRARAGGSA
jgi:hypothetical protein